MQKPVTDISYLPTDEGWIYMAAALDRWNREVPSYSICRHISLEMVMDVVAQLKGNGLNREIPIHSDIGRTHTNPRYPGHLNELVFR